MIDRHLTKRGTAVATAYERGQDWIVVRRHDTDIAMIRVEATRAGVRPNPLRTEAQMYAVALALGVGLSGKQLEEFATLRASAKPTATAGW